MKIHGFIYAVVSAFFFGSAGIFIKHSYAQNLTPSLLLTLQYIIAVVILFAVCLIKYRQSLKLDRKYFCRLIILGIGNTFMTLSLYSAMAYLDTAVATMLLYTYPVMVALFSNIFYDEKITAAKAAAIGGTFLGCLLVLNSWGPSCNAVPAIGIVFGISSAVFYSFMNIYSSRIVDKLPAAVVTFYSTIFSLAGLLLFNFSHLESLLHMNSGVYINAGLLAFFCEIIPLTLLYAAISKIGPVKASIISTLEIPISAVTAFWVMGEDLLAVQYFGIMLIVLSIMILRRE